MKPNNFPIRPNLNGSEELYTQTNDIPQKFTLESAKEFITKPTDIIYSELYNKVVNGELIAGQWYRLTDYRSVNFLNGGIIAENNPTPTDPNFNPQEIYTGETEVLILQATSPYEIAEIGYSETFNGDIVQYEPFTNKIGLDIKIYNGNTLPDSSTVSGFDLQWDGTNVYFNMPTGYPALFGHYFYLYAEFSGATYYQEGSFEPLTPNISIAQYPYTSDDPDFGYPKAMSRIKVEDGGNKIVLIDLDYNDYLNYDVDTLSLNTIYALGDAYGWITRRIDTYRNIDVPFDFRGRKYRRFEVDLSAVNPILGLGYWGIGDDHLGQGTTGNYKDFKSFGNDGHEAYNIKWNDMGGADTNGNKGINDNVVFLGGVFFNQIGAFFINNTIGLEFVDNIISNAFFFNTIGNYLNTNKIDSEFAYNTIGGNFSYNNINSGFSSNTILDQFLYNNISKDFGSNIIGMNFTNNFIKNDFGSNTIADNFQDNNIGNDFNGNTIGNEFNNNTIGNNFSNNAISDYFQGNSIQNSFSNNTIADNFGYLGGTVYGNNIGNNFVSNNIGTNFFNNLISNNFIGNTIGISFNNNEINKYFEDNTIGNKFGNNVTNGYVTTCIIGNDFTANKIDCPLLSGLDFTLSTHVYTVYNCRIMASNDSNLYLEYLNITTPTYVTPTA